MLPGGDTAGTLIRSFGFTMIDSKPIAWFASLAFEKMSL